MGIPAATKIASVAAMAALGTYISAHTAAAGTTGANEATGGGYARQATVWPGSANPSNGSAVNVPVAAATYAEFGIWSASTSGTFVGSVAFTAGSVVVSGSGASITISPSLAA